jgi:hypothetical protein
MLDTSLGVEASWGTNCDILEAAETHILDPDGRTHQAAI